MYLEIEGSVPRRLLRACFCSSWSTFIQPGSFAGNPTEHRKADAGCEIRPVLALMEGLFQLGVTFGRFLALFALGLIAAVWLQWSWLYWLLAAAALWELYKLGRS